MHATERADFQLLANSLTVVDDWIERVSPEGPRTPVAPGSPFAGDDRRSAPYHVSWGTWHSLSLAVDHLHCLRTVLLEAGTLHIYAPYTLIRAALENAAAAQWVLRPAWRDERVRRRLRLAAVDLRKGSKAADFFGLPLPRALDERLEDLRAIARRIGLNESDVVRRVTYEEIVETVGNELPRPSKLPLLIWRACSGTAHGDLWATINVTQREDMDGAPPGMVHSRVTAGVENLSRMTAATVELTKATWSLYDRRGKPPY